MNNEHENENTSPEDGESSPKKAKKKSGKKTSSFLTFSGDRETTSLSAASTWVESNRIKGAICPCCTQIAKRYKRKLSSSMAYALILIYRAFRKQSAWLHVPEYLTEVCSTGATFRGGDWAKMTHWGLIEPKEDEVRKDGSKRNGLYKITALGNAFVENRVRVPKYVFLFASKCLGLSEETISIEEALRKKNGFNYDELMAAT